MDRASVVSDIKSAVEAARLVTAGRKSVDALSHKEAEEQQDKYFASLDKTDDVTPEVKQAEAKAKLSAQRLKERELNEDAAEAHAQASTHAAVPAKHLTRRQALREQQAYYKSLDKQVHKTSEVLLAEAKAKASKHTLLYSGEAARDQLNTYLADVTKPAQGSTTLASHDLMRGERQRQHKGVRGRRHARAPRGKVDVRSQVRKAVYEAHTPTLPGKLKLQWKGRESAEKLYGKLKGQALASKGTDGRPREEEEEWDHHKNGIVDKMVQEFQKFKI